MDKKYFLRSYEFPHYIVVGRWCVYEADHIGPRYKPAESFHDVKPYGCRSSLL